MTHYEAQQRKDLNSILAKYGIEKVIGAYTLWNFLMEDLPQLYQSVPYRIAGIDSYYRRLKNVHKALSLGNPDWYVAHAKEFFVAAGIYYLYYKDPNNIHKGKVRNRPLGSFKYLKVKGLDVKLRVTGMHLDGVYQMIADSFGPRFQKKSGDNAVLSSDNQLGAILHDIVFATMMDKTIGPYDWYHDYIMEVGVLKQHSDTSYYMSWKKMGAFYGESGVNRTYWSDPFLKSVYFLDELGYTHAILNSFALYKDAVTRCEGFVETIDRSA